MMLDIVAAALILAPLPLALLLLITRRRESIYKLAHRADKQHNALMSGDLAVGVYGAYQPADLEKIPAVEALRQKLSQWTAPTGPLTYEQTVRAEQERLKTLADLGIFPNSDLPGMRAPALRKPWQDPWTEEISR